MSSPRRQIDDETAGGSSYKYNNNNNNNNNDNEDEDESTRVGLDDFVLLDDFTDENAFIENLRERHAADIVYTYIGPVLISVNPYKKVDIYNAKFIQEYRNTHLFELKPHIFSIADNSYRSMLRENRDECILISGESGAGKTEASKYILEFIAATSINNETIAKVKDKLLKSNEVLEAFGNAKTIRNHNSSRFGKYMDIRFDYKGTPNGGCILNYLLEKSRVVSHAKHERNFHIFYQLLFGADDKLLRDELKLERNINEYTYLTAQRQATANKPPTATIRSQSKSNGLGVLNRNSVENLATINGVDDFANFMDDVENFKQMQAALEICEFKQEVRQELFRIIGGILHLGNIKFEGVEHSKDTVDSVSKNDVKSLRAIENFSSLLSLSQEAVLKALTNRKFYVKNSEDVNSPLNIDQANHARDALAKDIYERVFLWIIKMINECLERAKIESTTVKTLNGNCVGILDIYGFEVFEQNGFEQFCINYCNEKLHELFIELTLKSEQEEYLHEEIEWESIDYFHNKIICDLIEQKPMCIIDILDEECSRPGQSSDQTFLDKLSEHFLKHPHFECNKTSRKSWKTVKAEDFSIKHYAGPVTYTVNGFLDKNNNLLFRSLKELMLTSKNQIIKVIYPSSELTEIRKTGTVASQFRAGLRKLMHILYSKEPSYVRCIKPNYFKRPDNFDVELVRHQVQYLSLLENLRVRRAGFAYRREYEIFLAKYKSLCPKTWPVWRGEPRDGVEILIEHLNFVLNKDFCLGKTKIFIRSSKTFFYLEDLLTTRKHYLASMIKARYRGYKQRRKYLEMKKSIMILTRNARKWLMKKKLEKRRAAKAVIKKFLIAYVHRRDPYGPINKVFLNMMYERYLTKLAKQLPKSIMDFRWPPCPEPLKNTSNILRDLYRKNLVRKYCLKFTPEKKAEMKEKVLASDLFKDRKESYAQSVRVKFANSRLADSSVYKNMPKAKQDAIADNKKFMNDAQNEKIKYSIIVDKFDRHGYKQRPRVLIFTDQYMYGLDAITIKLRDRISLKSIEGISVSKFADGFVVFHVKKPQGGAQDKGPDVYLKGDLIVRDDANHIEMITKLIDLLGKKNDASFLKIIDGADLTQNGGGGGGGQANEYSLAHFLSNGEKRSIKFTKSKSEMHLAAHKDKKGFLVVEI